MTYADGHDEGMWRALEAVMGRLPGDDRQKEMAWNISGLPMRMGGLGLRSAKRSAPAAYWASWADCVSMLQKRLPEVTTHIMDQLAVGAGGQGCLGELCAASRRLDQSGFVARPDWTQLKEGLRPPQPASSELGEWQHGWQFHASSPLEHHFRETVILAQSDAADRAHLRSHAGPGASEVLLGAPTAMEFKVERASVEPGWTSAADIEEHVPGQGGCVRGRLAQNDLWQECAAKPEQQSGRIRCFAT